MNKRTITHRDIRKVKLWRNFFMLYTASLAALYIALSLSGNEESTLLGGATSQTKPLPDTILSKTSSNQIPKTQLASYELNKN